MGGNILAAGTAAQILFGVFFTLLVLRVPSYEGTAVLPTRTVAPPPAARSLA